MEDWLWISACHSYGGLIPWLCVGVNILVLLVPDFMVYSCPASVISRSPLCTGGSQDFITKLCENKLSPVVCEFMVS